MPRKLARRAVRTATTARRMLARPKAGALSSASAGVVVPPVQPRRQVWLLASGRDALPPSIAGMAALDSWTSVLSTVDREQGAGRPLHVAVYPCAPLHCLDVAGAEIGDYLASSVAEAG